MVTGERSNSSSDILRKRVRSCSASSLDWIAISMPVSRQRWGLNCTFHRASKAAEALHKPLHKILPTMPNRPDYCRRIRLIPLSPANELPTVTAEVASSSLGVSSNFSITYCFPKGEQTQKCRRNSNGYSGTFVPNLWDL